MITPHDKAIVAAILAIVGLTNSFGLTHFNLDEHTVTTIVTVLMPVLVWLTPNSTPPTDTQKSTGG